MNRFRQMLIYIAPHLPLQIVLKEKKLCRLPYYSVAMLPAPVWTTSYYWVEMGTF